MADEAFVDKIESPSYLVESREVSFCLVGSYSSVDESLYGVSCEGYLQGFVGCAVLACYEVVEGVVELVVFIEEEDVFEQLVFGLAEVGDFDGPCLVEGLYACGDFADGVGPYADPGSVGGVACYSAVDFESCPAEGVCESGS